MSTGLQSQISEGGSNLSVGQKQLICLTRAILKKSKIVIIDEATANVDYQTGELIQKTIRSNFQECTVLTISHRLRTARQNNRLLVLGDGKVLEFDELHVLLNNPHSHFAKMIRSVGMIESNYLPPPLPNATVEAGESLEDEDTTSTNENDCLLR
ncbi:unnamed protein product [Rotaria sordida]|uniref:ABC transporter domain-containing protein n=1 Tax=Rotaria sordida TaxID=392033 RepID=A0A815JXX9_9BILA|nr:unnamed protein product [Rotaria sordida]